MPPSHFDGFSLEPYSKSSTFAAKPIAVRLNRACLVTAIPFASESARNCK